MPVASGLCSLRLHVLFICLPSKARHVCRLDANCLSENPPRPRLSLSLLGEGMTRITWAKGGRGFENQALTASSKSRVDAAACFVHTKAGRVGGRANAL